MTAGVLARLVPADWLRTPRPTARLRLTLLYGALFLVSGAVLLAVTYLLFDQALTTVTLPDGEKVFFGALHGNPLPSSGPRGAPTSQQMKKNTPAQAAEVHAQVAHFHAFALHELMVRSGIALGLTAVISIGLGWVVAGCCAPCGRSALPPGRSAPPTWASAYASMVPTTSFASSPPPTTISSHGSRPRLTPSGASWPMLLTSCAPRSR
jgi:hypothetical protein